MAKVRLNPLLVGISGRMGDVVFKRSSKGQVIVARYTKASNAEPSEAQKAQRQHFAQANAYARAAMADPHLRAMYEEMALRENKGAFALARSDYLKRKVTLPPRP